MDAIDRDFVVDLLAKRAETEEEALRAYYAGAIEAHCAQNAIAVDELRRLAEREGFAVDWTTELLAARTPVGVGPPTTATL